MGKMMVVVIVLIVLIVLVVPGVPFDICPIKDKRKADN